MPKGTWNHAICDNCWRKRNPDFRSPFRVVDKTAETCCFCVEKTSSGIYVREDPKSAKLKCGGAHE